MNDASVDKWKTFDELLYLSDTQRDFYTDLRLVILNDRQIIQPEKDHPL